MMAFKFASSVLVLLAAGILISRTAAAHEPEGEPADDRITGGGWILNDAGEKCNFSIGGAIKNGSPWGHLNFIDHTTGMHVKSTVMMSYTKINQNERRMQGHCTINGEGDFGFTVFAADNGEPGSKDTFHLFVQTGYHSGGYLGGGNIQLHKN
jgi:hypothetical protein